MGRGSSEGCLKWGGGGAVRDLSKNSLKQRVGEFKSCSQGDVLKVSPPLPPPPPRKISINTWWRI